MEEENELKRNVRNEFCQIIYSRLLILKQELYPGLGHCGSQEHWA